MHVNKYVHPCERIPNFIKASDLKLLQEDYEKDENERFHEQLIELDKAFIELLFGGSRGKHSRVKRFQTDYLPDEGYDSETENDLAYKMFLDDVKGLRNLVINFLTKHVNYQVSGEEKQQQEMTFFMNEINKADDNKKQLEAKIAELERDL